MIREILHERQIAFLEAVGRSPLSGNFYLTGGTALAAFYLKHRFSEDLDFFSEREIDVLALNVFLGGLKKKLGFSTMDFQQSFNRNLFFLYFPDRILKIEFTFYPFPRIEKGVRKYGLEIDSIRDIAVNKLFTIYQRIAARDYVDLYFICRERKFTIRDLTKKAKAKFDWHIDPLQLGTRFVSVKKAKDYPKMITPLDIGDCQKFFLEEAKKLKP